MPHELESGSDAILPSQFHPARSVHAIEPEARLALAVLEDAVATLRSAVDLGRVRSQRMISETWSWIACDDTTHPFTFVSICDYLGLDAPALRGALRRRYRHLRWVANDAGNGGESMDRRIRKFSRIR